MVRWVAVGLVAGLTALSCTRGKFDTSLGERGASDNAPGSNAGGEGGGGLTVAPGGSAGRSGGAGRNAGGASTQCHTNAECIDDHFDEPYVCQHGSCVRLETADCPLVLGAGYLRERGTIIVGAYSNFEPFATTAKSAYNYELAFEEFNATTGGLPDGPDGTRRPLVAVVCNSRDPDLRPSLEHLIDDLEVPAILATLQHDKLVEAFSIANDEKGADVLLLSPFDANDALRVMDDGGLLWHMLSSTRDLADAYAPLVTRAEAFQNALRPAPAEPIDVLMLVADYGANLELAEIVTRSVTFNGHAATDPENANHFTRVEIDSGLAVPSPDVSAAMAALDPAAPPHLVIALTTREVLGAIEPFELAFDESLGEPRPLYLLGPYLANEIAVTRYASDPQLPTLRDQLLGVNYLSPDSTLYDEYLARLTTAFPATSVSLESTENYYDAAYFLIYAFAAAGERATYRGPDLVEGLKKLIRHDVETEPCEAANGCYAVGPAPLPGALAYLRGANVDPAGIALLGTMGPPYFHPDLGVRQSRVGVWCVDDGDSGDVEFVHKTLEYDLLSGELRGTFTCFDGF
jgi:hypothetical protein